MKSSLINRINIIIGLFASIITIALFVCDHLKITIPKIIFPEIVIDIESIYSNYGIYIFLISMFIIICSLLSVRYKIKVYNVNLFEKYKEIVSFFKMTILTEEKFDYERLSRYLLNIYPYKNKSKINILFKREKDGEILYDTSNYDEWKHKEMYKIFHLRKDRFDWKAITGYLRKR